MSEPRQPRGDELRYRHAIGTVVEGGTCTGCGACVVLDPTGGSKMVQSSLGPVPALGDGFSAVAGRAARACPAYRLSYPQLYEEHYGSLPQSWLTGKVERARTGFAGPESIRRAGASGGVITQVLIHLLESGRVDGVIVAKQGDPTPLEARAVIATSPDEIISASQSVYIPVSMLEALSRLRPGKRYAMTALPDQSAALRRLALDGFGPARQVRYVLGPYTGTALYPAAIACYLRSRGVPRTDPVTRLRWRAGEWPGYLQIETESGRVLRSDKVYYNYLIPFFVTRNSLQNMDFANEFADLAAGDAWSPRFERRGGGVSVFVTRTPAMEEIVAEMVEDGLLRVEDIDPSTATDMHGHMLDFKRRGGYIRNQWRRRLGLVAPDFGFRPDPLPFSRFVVEVGISLVFLVAGTGAARWCLQWIPERLLGPIFDRLRMTWKSLSRPTKRKGLGSLRMIPTPPR